MRTKCASTNSHLVSHEAKAPVAEIVGRLDKLSSKHHTQYSLENILTAYCNDRYDLVLDPQMDKVLYQTPSEVSDITPGLIAFVKEHVKPLEL